MRLFLPRSSRRVLGSFARSPLHAIDLRDLAAEPNGGERESKRAKLCCGEEKEGKQRGGGKRTSLAVAPSSEEGEEERNALFSEIRDMGAFSQTKLCNVLYFHTFFLIIRDSSAEI